MADEQAPVAGRRALVVGLGASGRAASSALIEAGAQVTAVDEHDVGEAALELEARGVHVRVGSRPEQHLEGIELVVVSPGVPESSAVIGAAEERGLPVWSEPELAWRLHPAEHLVGITGTNGKTSVTELVAAMLTASGRDAVACGNIGTPLVTAAGRATPGQVLVAELSSFQLRFCSTLRPAVGVLLNLAPDHLDWHGSSERYFAAKARLWQAQAAADWAVVNADDDVAQRLAEQHARGRLAGFSVSGPVASPGLGVVEGFLEADLPGHSGRLLHLEELPSQAAHHRANVAAAATAALLAGAENDAVASAAREFTPGPHRLETVAERGGVVWVDDSKATNPHAAAAALSASGAAVWIAGGVAKGVDLAAIGPHLSGVRHAVLLGEAAEELTAVCGARGVPAARVASMREAVAAAAERARPGDTVLLAPACASLDMFEDYADRGRQFAEAVADLEVDGRG